MCENCDICFLSETHMTKGQNLVIPNFSCTNHPFSSVEDRKPRGGICCLVKEKYLQYIVEINKEIPEFMYLRLRGGHIIFSNYIPPIDSIYYLDEQFTNFPTILTQMDSNRTFIGGGDMNSRVGDINQKISFSNCF